MPEGDTVWHTAALLRDALAGYMSRLYGRPITEDRINVTASGVNAIAVALQSIVDPSRSRDPVDFWAGYELRLLDAQGAIVAKAAVASFDASRGLILEKPLTAGPLADQAYELTAGEEAPILAIRQLLALRLHEAIPPVTVRLGTTRGTNALITRRGAKCAFVTTRGFGDVLRIGYQNRPGLFARHIQLPQLLYARVVEAHERIDASGSVLEAFQVAKLEEECVVRDVDGEVLRVPPLQRIGRRRNLKIHPAAEALMTVHFHRQVRDLATGNVEGLRRRHCHR